MVIIFRFKDFYSFLVEFFKVCLVKIDLYFLLIKICRSMMVKGCELLNNFLSWWKFFIRLFSRDNVYLNFVCIYKIRKYNFLSWWILRIAYFLWINWVLVCIRIYGYWVFVEMLLYLIAWKNCDDDVIVLIEVDFL